MKEVIASREHGNVFESLIEKGEINYDIDIVDLPNHWTPNNWTAQAVGMLKMSGFNDLKVGDTMVLYGDDQEAREKPTISIKVGDGGFFDYMMIDHMAEQFMIVVGEGHHDSMPPHEFTQRCLEREGINIKIIAPEEEVAKDQDRKDQDQIEATKKYRAQDN